MLKCRFYCTAWNVKVKKIVVRRLVSWGGKGTAVFPSLQKGNLASTSVRPPGLPRFWRPYLFLPSRNIATPAVWRFPGGGPARALARTWRRNSDSRFPGEGDFEVQPLPLARPTEAHQRNVVVLASAGGELFDDLDHPLNEPPG